MKRFIKTLFYLLISMLLLVGLSFSSLAGEERAEIDHSCSLLEMRTCEEDEIVCDICELKNKECSERKKISEMSDKELKQFLENYVFTEDYVCVEYPEYKDGMFALLKTYLHEFDSNGATPIPLEFKFYHTWAEKIDKGIEQYYDGAITKKGLPGSTKASSYTPTQNVFYSIPNNMGSFNCYGYAVGLYGWIRPGFANNDVYNLESTTAASLAYYVKRDLKSSFFNMNCVKTTPICPSSSILSSGKQVICIRWGKTPDNLLYDYHLMKLTNQGWLHKPSASAIIKHTVPHSSSTTWLNEYTYDGTTWINGSFNYMNQIYYIIYQANHSSSLTYTGNHYHSGNYHYYEKAYVCDHCGSQYGAYYEKVRCSGPPCIRPFAIVEDEVDR